MRGLGRLPVAAACGALLLGCGGANAGAGAGAAPSSDAAPGMESASPDSAPASTARATAPATAPAALEPSPPFELATLRLLPPRPAPSGGADSDAVSVPVYVAADHTTRGHGLMNREELPDGTGMVFLFPGERHGGFYMKDTLMPLSIAFYGADGRVLEVLDMQPCTANPCTIYTPAEPYVGALEVEQGWFDEVGVEAGWRVELPQDLPAAS